MRYLGKISGTGKLQCPSGETATTAYEFDGYYRRQGGVTSCGEIQLSPTVLKGVFGLPGLQLITEDGRRLNLRFSEKTLPPNSKYAHVDVTGDLPTTPQTWRH
ncbi:hypothetical protein [Oceanibaculum pacificum]|uniref:Uncharacterized protein n=1 Tax=Oceanibaculum pacificum TaxID=580166 RepID=A0A154W2Y7_9PROT|nr:hypothetical protein [Oceanibaculum pacificum]KZD07856.1 hypothetical protein AUP43_09545 [Oceanibaculum pacificum]